MEGVLPTWRTLFDPKSAHQGSNHKMKNFKDVSEEDEVKTKDHFKMAV
jgi:hypothetical protein